MQPVNNKKRRTYQKADADAEQAILRAVAHWHRDHGRSPSYREIERHTSLSRGTVQRVVDRLEADGRIVRKEGARGLFIPTEIANRLVRNVGSLLDTVSPQIPILGTVAAGAPIDEVLSDPEMISVPPDWVRGRCYLLRIRGDSMSGDAICDGDLVLVQATDEVVAGAIHVCWLPDDGATIKRVRTKADVTELVASNERYRPRTAPAGTIVQGRVIWVLRNLAPKKRRRRT